MIRKILLTGLVLCVMVSFANAADSQQERGYISLKGSASREVTPNIAEITFAIENTNKDVKIAIAPYTYVLIVNKGHHPQESYRVG